MAKKRVGRYPVGSRTLVHYDPARPDRACLERTAGGPLFIALVGLVFAVVGLFLL